jgi:hypothetical protein
MNPIPAATVDTIWQKMIELSPAGGRRMLKRLEADQPIAFAFLMTVDDDVLNEDERGLLVYVGMGVWQMMSQGATPVPKVTEDLLQAAQEASTRTLNPLVQATEEQAGDVVKTMLDGYSQPEVLRYVTDTLTAASGGCADDDEPGVRQENLGAMLLDLKMVIDCFNA